MPPGPGGYPGGYPGPQPGGYHPGGYPGGYPGGGGYPPPHPGGYPPRGYGATPEPAYSEYGYRPQSRRARRAGGYPEYQLAEFHPGRFGASGTPRARRGNPAPAPARSGGRLLRLEACADEGAPAAANFPTYPGEAQYENAEAAEEKPQLPYELARHQPPHAPFSCFSLPTTHHAFSRRTQQEEESSSLPPHPAPARAYPMRPA